MQDPMQLQDPQALHPGDLAFPYLVGVESCQPQPMPSCPCAPQGLPASNHPAMGSPSTYVRPFLRASYTSSRRLG